MTNSTLLDRRQPGPAPERVRHEVKMRAVEVADVLRLTPAMVRIVFRGDDLADFPSRSFDDHVKLFVRTPSGEAVRRDYTPRRFDRAARTLTLDFAVHEAGPATLWALQARPGEKVTVGGPKGSTVPSDALRRWVLVGDETALPAIGRHIEEAAAGVSLTSVVAVPGPQDQQTFETRADLTARWAHRSPAAADDPGPLLAQLVTVELTPETFVWIAAEATVARAVRAYVAQERGHALTWMKAGGYWVKGRADAHERME